MSSLSLSTRLIRGPYSLGMAARNQTTGRFCLKKLLVAAVERPEWVVAPLVIGASSYGILYGYDDSDLRKNMYISVGVGLAYSIFMFALGFIRSNCARFGKVLGSNGLCRACTNPAATKVQSGRCVNQCPQGQAYQSGACSACPAGSVPSASGGCQKIPITN